MTRSDLTPLVSPPRAPAQRAFLILLGIYLLAVAVILLNPSGTVSSDGTSTLTRWATDLHLPTRVVARVEFLANVAITTPLPILATLVLGRRRIGSWVSAMFVGSLAVESIQHFFFADRVGSFSDIVANTLGALVGALIAWGVCWVRS